ncbi:hypothetical protein Glove_21g289 [Diversispora epigaea]|uniref:Uncharacterized protein n=1 Tax=Diversispora epigaea TaxID=1348612 RepID=A0A397JWG4_9GLOM|nr:hypothetical protein Glove_21g289 [Diversispora epigaea]
MDSALHQCKQITLWTELLDPIRIRIFMRNPSKINSDMIAIIKQRKMIQLMDFRLNHPRCCHQFVIGVEAKAIIIISEPQKIRSYPYIT